MSINHKFFSHTCFFIIVSSGLASTSTQAALIETELPTNTYITLNGFNWAWGANCSTKIISGCDTIDTTFQSSFGWRIAEAVDMAYAPTALDFLFSGANVPFNGADPISGAVFDSFNAAYNNAASAGACATAYFTLGDGDNACNWVNGLGQDTNTLGWFNQNGESQFISDVLFVRDVNTIPVPAAVWLFGSGLMGLLGVARRKKS